MPVPAEPRLVEDVFVRGDYELDPRGLVCVEDGTVLREEPHPRLVAISAIDVVVPVFLVVVVGDAVRALARGLGVSLLPLVVDGAHKDVRPHADFLHQLDRALGLLRTSLAPNPLHVLAVRDEIREDRLHLLPRELLVPAVQLQNVLLPDIVVGADAKVHPRVNVRHRPWQVEVKDLDGDGDGEMGERGAGNGERDAAAVDAGGGARSNADRQEELLRNALLKRNRLDGVCVRETGAHRGERLFLLRRIEPPLRRLAVCARDPRVVRLLRSIDADEVLVVEQQFGAELHACVGKVAEPSVLVLVPDLDDGEIKVVGGEDVARLAHKLPHDRLYLAEIDAGADDERAGLVFAARGDDPDCSSPLAVGGNSVRQTLHAAHGRHRPPCHVGQRWNGGQGRKERQSKSSASHSFVRHFTVWSGNS